MRSILPRDRDKTLTLPVVQLLVCAEGARCPIHDGVRIPNRIVRGRLAQTFSAVTSRRSSTLVGVGQSLQRALSSTRSLPPRIRVTDNRMCNCSGATYAPEKSTPGTPARYPTGDRSASERSGTSQDALRVVPHRGIAARGGVLRCVGSCTDCTGRLDRDRGTGVGKGAMESTASGKAWR
jgi:hypothetical protein